MFGFGLLELLIIIAAVVLFFGAKRLPDIGKNLGKGIGEFKRSLDIARGEVIDVDAERSDRESGSDKDRKDPESDSGKNQREV
jgi:TatA/E family protein of Tat protein translocase